MVAILGDDAYAESSSEVGPSGAERPGDAEMVCAVLHCARTGQTPDGECLNDQPGTFGALVGAAHLATAFQARMNTKVFFEMTKMIGSMTR